MILESSKKLMEFALEEEAMIHVLSERSIVQRDQQSHMADFHMGIYQTMFDKITDKLGKHLQFFLPGTLSRAEAEPLSQR